MASFNTAGAANPNPNKSLEVRAHAWPLPAALGLNGENLLHGPIRLRLPSFCAGESAAGGLGFQPQLQPQGQPPHRHLLGQPGQPAAAAAVRASCSADKSFLFPQIAE
jgi:hypothetical protein